MDGKRYIINFFGRIYHPEALCFTNLKKRTFTMNKRQYMKKSVHLSIGTVLGCMLFLFSTNPERLPLPMLLIMPLLMTGFAVGILRMALIAFTDWGVDRIRQLSLVGGTGVLVIALLNSLSQLGIQDIVLCLALIAGLAFYLRRFQSAV